MLQNVKLTFIDQYFNLKNSHFSIIEEIRNQVDFSPGDIIDPGYTSPPSAIFADFDLVSCCNVMIYYSFEIQKMILEKLYRSLSRNGYLLVGETERLIVEKFGKFRLVYPIGDIFIKN
jgi:chemotaxis methyl-accepting protein methylase